MNGNKFLSINRLTLIYFIFSLIFFFPKTCFAKLKAVEKDGTIPTCTVTGEIECPKGFKPNCPEQYKPSCIFLINKQHPACLADSPDTTAFNYRLDKISCKKGKGK